MQTHILGTSPARPGILRRNQLASALALALSLSATASMAGNRGPQHPLAPTAQTTTEVRLNPEAVFRQIQDWRASHQLLLPEGPTQNSTTGGTTRTVTNCNDDGTGSLREAIGDSASGDTVDMAGLSCSTITLDDTILFNDNDLNLKGSIVSGFPRPIIQGAAGSTSGLLNHTGTGTLDIENLTLSNGVKYGFNGGGCITSLGSVDVSDSIIKDCRAVQGASNSAMAGGGIYAAGAVGLHDSVISGNSVASVDVAANGGGVHAGGYFVCKYSAIIGNSATSSTSYGQRGGVSARDGANIKYSTIGNNTAGDIGGISISTNAANGAEDNVTLYQNTIARNVVTDDSALSSSGMTISTSASNTGNITLKGNTITFNDSHSDGASALASALFIFSNSAVTANLENNLISNNVSFSNFSYSALEASTAVTITGNHNLIGNVTNATVPGDTIYEIRTGTSSLGDYGGPTPTVAFTGSSWAFNRGLTDFTQDQRSMPRPVGTGDDIGAIETDVLFVDRFEEPPYH